MVRDSESDREYILSYGDLRGHEIDKLQRRDDWQWNMVSHDQRDKKDDHEVDERPEQRRMG
jgi:hypothetical protein